MKRCRCLPSRIRRLLALTCAVMWPATALSGQVIRVELLDSTTSLPIAGALVSASHEARRGTVDALTNASGVANLRVPVPGLWDVSVRRIGMRPRTIPSIRVDSAGLARLTLRLTRMRQALPRVRVVADAGQCGRANHSCVHIASIHRSGIGIPPSPSCASIQCAIALCRMSQVRRMSTCNRANCATSSFGLCRRDGSSRLMRRKVAARCASSACETNSGSYRNGRSACRWSCQAPMYRGTV
jgi:Carboxypeptidase regulatory-like domain